jgi:hypothetical protein
MKENNEMIIYKILNRNQNKNNNNKMFPFFSFVKKNNNSNQTNNPTKPKLEPNNNKNDSQNDDYPQLNCNNISNNKNSKEKDTVKNNTKNEVKTVSSNQMTKNLNFNERNNNKENNTIFKDINNNRLINEATKDLLENFEREINEIKDLRESKNDNYESNYNYVLLNFPYEIKYFFINSNQIFNYDFENQNANNSNYQYVKENFIDILIISYNKKMILNSNIKPMQKIQTEINFSKRNILVSWLTEINFKYIKDQNILFTGINFLDRILYTENININEFQLLGIICFNLALKMENHHKVLLINEIISLIGGLGGDSSNNNNNCNNHNVYKSKEKEKRELVKKIKNMENKVCAILNFELEISTSILILRRLIQILNINNKKTEELFCAIANFFLELSLYDENFYKLDDFVKALSSLLIAKELLKKYYYKIGNHEYIKNCSKLKKKEIKYYFSLCTSVIRNLKMYKYGSAFFIKYQHKEFYYVIDNYLNWFIDDCIRDKKIAV